MSEPEGERISSCEGRPIAVTVTFTTVTTTTTTEASMSIVGKLSPSSSLHSSTTTAGPSSTPTVSPVHRHRATVDVKQQQLVTNGSNRANKVRNHFSPADAHVDPNSGGSGGLQGSARFNSSTSAKDSNANGANLANHVLPQLNGANPALMHASLPCVPYANSAALPLNSYGSPMYPTYYNPFPTGYIPQYGSYPLSTAVAGTSGLGLHSIYDPNASYHMTPTNMPGISLPQRSLMPGLTPTTTLNSGSISSNQAMNFYVDRDSETHQHLLQHAMSQFSLNPSAISIGPSTSANSTTITGGGSEKFDGSHTVVDFRNASGFPIVLPVDSSSLSHPTESNGQSAIQQPASTAMDYPTNSPNGSVSYLGGMASPAASNVSAYQRSATIPLVVSAGTVNNVGSIVSVEPGSTGFSSSHSLAPANGVPAIGTSVAPQPSYANDVAAGYTFCSSAGCWPNLPYLGQPGDMWISPTYAQTFCHPASANVLPGPQQAGITAVGSPSTSQIFDQGLLPRPTAVAAAASGQGYSSLNYSVQPSAVQLLLGLRGGGSMFQNPSAWAPFGWQPQQAARAVRAVQNPFRFRAATIFANSPSCTISPNPFDPIQLKRLFPQLNPDAFDESLLFRTRYFVIKSDNEHNVLQSIHYNVWCSTRTGNQCLNEAYLSVHSVTPVASSGSVSNVTVSPQQRSLDSGLSTMTCNSQRNSDSSRNSSQHSIAQNGAASDQPDENHSKDAPGHILFFFFVRTSRQLIGVAEMLGPVKFEENLHIWQECRFHGKIPIRWIYVKNVPNTKLQHISNESPDNRPISMMRDTSEIVPAAKGEELLRIVHDYIPPSVVSATMHSSSINIPASSASLIDSG